MLPQHLQLDIIYGPNTGEFQLQNRMFWTLETGTPTLTKIAQVADHGMALFAPLYADVLSNQWQVMACRAHWIGPDNDWDAVSSDGATGGSVEAADGETLPEFGAVIIRRRTGAQGRDKRGRIFIGGVCEAMQDQGRLTGPGFTKYKAIANKMDQTFICSTPSLNFAPVTPSYKTNSLTPVTHSQLVIDVRTRRDRMSPKGLLWSSVVGV